MSGGTRLILEREAVGAYLREHDLIDGNVPIDAILLQENGTVEGRPAVMFVFVLPDGRRVVGKTTLRLLAAAMGGIKSTLDRKAAV